MIDRERPHQCSVYSADGELNGAISDIGRKLWTELAKVAPWLQDAIESGSPTEIEYCDRYLLSPLACRLLYEVLKTLSEKGDNVPSLQLLTMSTSSSGYPRFLFHNWSDSREQESTLKALLGSISKPTIVMMDRFRLPHARTMKIKWSNGMSASITFDQGMGFARLVGRIQHSFGTSGAVQAKSMLGMNFHIEQNSHKVPFYIMGGE
ncbi:hypothetical protein [uncultured Rubinisphaera sp.]|uniref:hypothetical protein n=1 Tax=uncultured Rubinisphaera sp. TaxID=1678686 RepID=UPI000ED153A3|nr:hypothetical protein [Planctomycetaceae bacterium]|tara:strand:- start:261 stop:881 length:621 start_codon:yes stop_codon:yes gene_type:complete